MGLNKKYLKFVEVINEKGITRIFRVVNLSGEHLGIIKWRSGWRKYVYETTESVYDSKCLNEIIEFLNKLMDERKK